LRACNALQELAVSPLPSCAGLIKQVDQPGTPRHRFTAQAGGGRGAAGRGAKRRRHRWGTCGASGAGGCVLLGGCRHAVMVCEGHTWRDCHKHRADRIISRILLRDHSDRTRGLAIQETREQTKAAWWLGAVSQGIKPCAVRVGDVRCGADCLFHLRSPFLPACLPASL